MLTALILALQTAPVPAKTQQVPPPATQAAAAELPISAETLGWLKGDWAVYLEGKPVADRTCGQGTRYEPSADGRTIVAIRPGKADSTPYRVIRVEQDRVLTIIADETRLNEQGDPVLWWFVRKGPDEFAFRQYGWAPDGRTAASWKRCPV